MYYSLWQYFYAFYTPKVTFGHWDTRIGQINREYHQIISRLWQFAREAGNDRYDRSYNFEELLNFAIAEKITNESVDHIYREYVHDQIARTENDLDEFVLVPTTV